MKYPRLKIRPMSTQSCSAFGGLRHQPKAALGNWYDERNLSADRSPLLSVRRERGSTGNSVDGNEINVDVAAVCSGDHLIVLDTMGKLWCNGNTFELLSFYDNWVRFTVTTGTTRGKMLPASGKASILGPEGTPAELLQPSTWTENPIVSMIKYEEFEDSGVYEWNAYDESGTQIGTNIDPADYGMSWDGDDPDEIAAEEGGITVTISGILYQPDLEKGAEMVIMGNRLIIIYDQVNADGDLIRQVKTWVDINALATGATMVQGTNYGDLDVSNYYNDENDVGPTSGHRIRLQICTMEGEKISAIPGANLTVSESEPAGSAGKYWLDSSESPVSLKSWSTSTLSWVVVEHPYVSVYCRASGIVRGVSAGDTVKLSFVPKLAPGTTPSAELQSAIDLLNGYHYVVHRWSGDNTFVVEGLIEPASGNQIMLYLDHATGQTTAPYLLLERKAPDMDYLVAAGNRLWGCRYDEAAGINEIYASKLGDPSNWQAYQGLSTDSWAASRGTPAPFTGAAVLDGHPLFFREESLEKVYPSSSGAHQIQTFDLEGVERGAADSLVVIDDRLFYKGRAGIMMYTGTLPQRISDDAFGGMVFRNGSATRHKRKYCISMDYMGDGHDILSPTAAPERVVGVFDLATGDWHLEDDAWTGKAITWRDELLYVKDGKLMRFESTLIRGRVQWWCVTAPQTLELTEHRWISYIRIRFKMLSNGTRQPNVLKVYISYDDGDWHLASTSIGPHNPAGYVEDEQGQEYEEWLETAQVIGQDTRLETGEITIYPRRCDNFRLRFEGYGPTEIYEISYRMERSEGGH